MKSTSNYKEKDHLLGTTTILLIFSITCVALITYTNNMPFQPSEHYPTQKVIETCDLFKGRWIPDADGPLYTNYSCTTIPTLKNCLLHGRKDTDFLHWRWKPDKCELPRFSAQTFLRILRGKKMAFIGDSLARNQMESLLCLLSTEETPKLIEKDADNKFTTWEFPKHNFTLMVFWSAFLVTAAEIVVNGTGTGNFDLHLDTPDPKWSEKLPSVDYAIINSGQWHLRGNYLYEDGKVMGCVFCHDPNITYLGPGVALRRSFRAAFKAVNDCNKCNKIVTFLRTFSPSHFEHGEWNTGGKCNRTRLIGLDEVDRARPDWEYRNIQVEEAEAARNVGRERGNEFGVIDVTEMMLTRVDGHPGAYWIDNWTTGYKDCVHWCMPGPVDTWNELLLEMIKRHNRISS
ncbi:xyloglucan O-acetyltransferase 3-like [Salvia hispanica]|uniref:xyloglucan O-acetyltransferase 3-like n=1 Tax=Salvia hispanica TaxID=49212 RepID=UPI00200937CE|nr:xyloglucan O-acetyltransferase 3-like [Salvia hispanica]